MSGSRYKKMWRYTKKYAQSIMRDNILVYQTLPFMDRFRIAKAILFRLGDGSPKTKEKK